VCPKFKLTSYTGNEVPVLGNVSLQCKYKSRSIETLFHIVDTSAIPLLSLQTSVDLGLVKLTYSVANDSSGLDRQDVLRDYADLFSGIGVIPGTCKLHLKEDAVPVVNPTRRVPEALRSRLQDELQRMEKNDIISKVSEPTDWVNSLVVVEKPKTGQLRICLDPKALNESIRRPHYPMPTLEDVTLKLHGSQYFSLLDITHAYWSIRLDEESSYLCTFGTPFGRYRFLRLPFGISSSQDIFQQKVNEISKALKVFWV
jgi:Reverse transcriptase (RNA-dependent DNA polymerase)